MSATDRFGTALARNPAIDNKVDVLPQGGRSELEEGERRLERIHLPGDVPVRLGLHHQGSHPLQGA